MKWILIGAGAVVILAIAAVASVPYLVDLPRTQAYIAQQASHALARPVEFSDFSVSVLPLPAIVLKDLQVAEDPRFGSGPFLSVGEGHLRLRLGALLGRRVEFAELVLDRPRIALIQDPAGRWNVASLGARPSGPVAPPTGAGRGAEEAAPLPVVSRLRVVEGSLQYQIHRRNGPAITYRAERIGLTLEGLGGGTPLKVEGTSEVSPGAILIRLDGTLGPLPGGGPLTAAPVTGHVALEAREVGTLAAQFLGPSPSLSGSANGKLTLTGTLARLAIAGELEAARLTLAEQQSGCPPPETRSLTVESVRVPLSYDPLKLTSRPLSARFQKGSVTLTLDLSWEPRSVLSLKKIAVKTLPLAPILVDYLCQGYAVTGPLDLTGELSARPDRLVSTLTGQGQMKIGAGKVVGPAALALFGSVARVGGALSSVLNVDLPLSLFSAPMKFQSITSTYRIVNGRLSTQDFLYTSERMTVAGAGEYGLVDRRVNFDLTMTHGRGRIKAKVTGTAASPSVRVDPGSIRGIEPGKVRSGLQKFLEGLSK